MTHTSSAGMQLPEWVGLANGYTIWVDSGQLYVRHTCGHQWKLRSGIDVNEVAYHIDQHTCADLLPHRLRPRLMDVVRGSLPLRAAGLAGLFSLFSALVVWVWWYYAQRGS